MNWYGKDQAWQPTALANVVGPNGKTLPGHDLLEKRPVVDLDTAGRNAQRAAGHPAVWRGNAQMGELGMLPVDTFELLSALPGFMVFDRKRAGQAVEKLIDPVHGALLVGSEQRHLCLQIALCMFQRSPPALFGVVGQQAKYREQREQHQQNQTGTQPQPSQHSLPRAFHCNAAPSAHQGTVCGSWWLL